jgi:hypothetical protein
MFFVSNLLSYSEAGRREILRRKLTASRLPFAPRRPPPGAHSPTFTHPFRLSFVEQLIKNCRSLEFLVATTTYTVPYTIAGFLRSVPAFSVSLCPIEVNRITLLR